MHYKTLLSAFLVGMTVTGTAAQGGFGQGRGGQGQGKGGQGQVGQGQGKGGQGQAGAGSAATATAAQSAAASATAASSAAAKATGATGTTGGNAGGNAGGSDTLNPKAVQTGSQADGQAASGSAAGQAASATDAANFINFCVGQTLTNGLQNKAGSCNGIPMGQIPASTQMVSTIITNPQLGQVVEENQTFNLSANIQNIQAGSFTNPDATYYSAPQQLNNAGEVIGHMHFSVQTMGNSLNPTTALDASKFAFFKGVNDAGDGKGNLQATVTGGLPAGNYRVCTMSSASNHQPVLMPVAQRGPQDDCTKFVVGNGGAGGNGGNGGNAGGAASSAAAGGASTATASAASSATSAAAAAGGNTGGNKGGKGAAGGKGAGAGGAGGKGTGAGNRARFVRYYRG